MLFVTRGLNTPKAPAAAERALDLAEKSGTLTHLVG
jgi:hypothetical protein